MMYLLAHIVSGMEMGNDWIDLLGGMADVMVVIGLLGHFGVI